MNSTTLATLAALALTSSLAGSGCTAQSNDADEAIDGQEELANGADNQATEKTGEAEQACGFGGGFGWGGFGWGGFGWGGFGGGFAGWGGFGWGGCGCGGFGGGFGWGGFGWGGFGGCW
jgi:hypothetical protein